jgi:hypothetical protein
MFARISASFALAKSSWNVLWKDKRLIAFPMISGFFCLLITLSFVIPFAAIESLRKMVEDQNPLLWVFLFVFYLVTYFIVIFFNSALTSCALMRFNGEEPTLEDGLRAAASRLPQILAWALVSATVGIVLKMIESANDKVGRFISALLGTAWTVMTFFVIPVLVVERVGPFQAIGRSLQILKKTWGEALVGNLGIGIFAFLLGLPGFLLLFAGIMLCFVVLPVGLIIAGVALLYLLVWAAASAALSGIFVSALYQYAAHDRVPEAFDRDTLAMAFKHKAG